MLFPDEWDALEFAKTVSLGLQAGMLHWLSQHEVKHELFAPKNDALDDIEGEHAQAVQNVDALFH